MEDQRVKHLELIQGVADRVARNSFACKAWTVSLVTGVFVFATRSGGGCVWVALIPTLARQVYANKFSARGKTIVFLYNGCPFTVDGPVLRVAPRPDRHFVELLKCRELAPVPIGNNRYAIHLKLRREDVACVAELPKLLTIRKSGSGRIGVSVSEKARKFHDLRFVLAAKEGEKIAQMRAQVGVNTLVTEAHDEIRPACVKLFSGVEVLDVVVVVR